jgi:hypothetical protein
MPAPSSVKARLEKTLTFLPTATGAEALEVAQHLRLAADDPTCPPELRGSAVFWGDQLRAPPTQADMARREAQLGGALRWARRQV